MSKSEIVFEILTRLLSHEHRVQAEIDINACKDADSVSLLVALSDLIQLTQTSDEVDKQSNNI